MSMGIKGINMIISSIPKMIKLENKHLFEPNVKRFTQPSQLIQFIIIILTLWIRVYALFVKELLEMNSLLGNTFV